MSRWEPGNPWKVRGRPAGGHWRERAGAARLESPPGEASWRGGCWGSLGGGESQARLVVAAFSELGGRPGLGWECCQLCRGRAARTGHRLGALEAHERQRGGLPSPPQGTQAQRWEADLGREQGQGRGSPGLGAWGLCPLLHCGGSFPEPPLPAPSLPPSAAPVPGAPPAPSLTVAPSPFPRSSVHPWK